MNRPGKVAGTGVLFSVIARLPLATPPQARRWRGVRWAAFGGHDGHGFFSPWAHGDLPELVIHKATILEGVL